MPENAVFKNDLRRSRLVEVDFSESRMHNIWMENARITGADFINTEIWGSCEGLVWNGIPIAPLVNAELMRMHPELAKLKPTTPDGFREAWSIIENLWETALNRVQRLPEPILYERVDSEWSFAETLRHLVGGTDSWIFRCIAGAQDHWSATAPLRGWGDIAPSPDDPRIEEILAVRRDRMTRVRALIDALTDAELDRICEQNPQRAYPEVTTHPVRRCLQGVISEEWAHHQYACRDLDVLESRSTTAGPTTGL